MAQNSSISSRKQELLSRLKNTLAIVSQATGFDRLDEDRHLGERRDVHQRQIDPRSVDRRQRDINAVDPVTRGGDHSQIDMNPLDPRLYRTHVGMNTHTDEPVRWSGQRDGDLRQPVRNHQMQIDDDDDPSIYRRMPFPSPAPPAKPCLKSSSSKPIVESSFAKFGEIEDEDEFLYGKEDVTPKASSTSQMVDDSRWLEARDGAYRSGSSQSSASLSSGYMRATTRSPLPHQFSNSQVDHDLTRLHAVGSQSQQPFNFSSSYHMAPESVRAVDDARVSQQPIGASLSSNSDGLSALGNVNTDMLQNILKLVSLQKPCQPRHDQSSNILGASEWTRETLSPPQQPNVPNVGSVIQRTSMPQTSSSGYNAAISDFVSSSREIQETSLSLSHADARSANLTSMRYRGSDVPYTSTPVMIKEQDLESKPSAMLSGMKMSAMVSEAASDTGSRMSALVSAVESETSSKMSDLLSVVADDTAKHASKIEKAEADVKDEVFDRLITMLGCNSNIKSIMQQLIKKEKADSEISKKKVADSLGTEQKKINQQFQTYMQVDNVQKEEQIKQVVTIVKAEVKEARKLKSPSTSETLNFGSDISEEEDSKSSASIPIVSSLAKLQNNYDSDPDYNSQSAAKSSDKLLSDRMKANEADVNEVSARDSEWEKNTAEFLRRLQTKKCIVTPREKSRSPFRKSRDRPRSPMTRSRDKSLSPRRKSEDRLQPAKQAAKKNPGLDKSVSSNTATKKPADCKDRSQSPRATTKSMPSTLSERSESPRTPVVMVELPKGSVKSPKTVLTKYDDVQGKDASCKSKYSNENKKEDVPDQKLTEQVHEDKPSVDTLSDEDQSQLVKAKEELSSTIALLMSELEKLRVERSALALKADGRHRNEELRKNIALQEEMGEHICSLKKALNELNCQLNRADPALITSAPVSKPEAAEQKKQPDKSRKENNTRIVLKKDATRNRSRSSTGSTSSSRSSSSSSSSSSRSRSRSRSGMRSSRRHYHRRHNSRDRYKARRAGSGKKSSNQASSRRNVIVEKNKSKQSEGKNVKQSGDKASKPGDRKNVVQSLPASKPSTLDNQKPDLQESACETANTTVGKVSTDVNKQVVSLGSTSSAGISSAMGNQSEEPVRAVGCGSADRGGASAFSRENLISSLQQMVRATEDSTSFKEKNEPYTCVMKEKQTSALELAIAMYLAANEFYDGGNLWCRLCDGIFHDISALCRHIHSDQHQLKLDINYNQPKHPSVMHKPSCSDGSFVAPARGDEFLMPIQSFFCSLCCEYSKDSTSAETHLKSQAHNAKFKGFLKDNPTYEMQFLRGKMFAAQNVMEIQKDITQQRTEEQSNSEQLDDINTQASDVSKPKRKFEEAETDVKRVKIERKITNDVLKIERKVVVDEDKVTATREVEKDTRKIILMKENNDKTEGESRSDTGKGVGVKKNAKAGPDKEEKTSSANRGRSPEKYRERVESRSWDKRDTSDRWKGHREDRNDDRRWKSPQFTGRKESPHQTQEDKKRPATAKNSEEKSLKISAEDQRGRDSPSKPGSSKESSSRGVSSLSPTNIPLPENPLSKSFEPFKLGRGSKLVRQPLKKPGFSSTREAGRPGASANFNFQDFEVLDECGDA